MSPSCFWRHLVYLFSESKGRLIPPPPPQKKILFVPFKRIPEKAVELCHKVYIKYNHQQCCVSKYAYAAVTNFKWDT